MGSCLRARARKTLRSLLLKLFSRGFVFIVTRNFKPSSVPHHAAVAGFWSPSFEGTNKSGAAGAGLVTFYLEMR
jgi:hypothetical protein